MSVVVGGTRVVVGGGGSVVVNRSVVVARVVVCGRVVVGDGRAVTDVEELDTFVDGLVVAPCVVLVVDGRVEPSEVVGGSVAVGASAGGRVIS